MPGISATPIIRMQQRLEKGMNIIEAHRIVHDYIDTIALGTDEFSLAFRCTRLLKDDPWRIRDAYFVFYGHMILYNTLTQEEYEAYDMCLKMISYFVSGYQYDEIIKNERYLNTHKKNFFNKRKYEQAEKEKSEYLKMMLDPIKYAKYGGIYTDIQQFFYHAQELKRNLVEQIKFEKLTHTEIKHIYCNSLFNNKTITLGPCGIELFEPFETLYLILRKDKLSELNSSVREKYLDYIINSI